MTPTTAGLRRPRVICHMAASIDGRIVVNGWPESVAAAVRREYDELHAGFGAEGWMCGRITMEPFAKGLRSDAEVAREYEGSAQRAGFRAEADLASFAFAMDPRGRLAWESNEISGDHVVAILSQRVSNEYLAFLREMRVSYLLTGTKDIDLALALEKIGAVFGVRTLLFEGGGRINGAMLRAGLIDELSLLVAPVGDGEVDRPAVFDVSAEAHGPALRHRERPLVLQSIERRPDNILWLRYQLEAAVRP